MMTEPDSYDFEKLAREIITSRLKDIPADTAAAAAAEVASKIIVAGVTSTAKRQDPHLTVAGICRGVMSGMLLIEKDLVATAVALVKSMAHLALETHLDPADMMTWAMEGIAAVCVVGHGDLKANVREALEQNFMGTGEVFGELLAKAAPPKD
ncbi:MAG: hypothetical protein HY926_15580 [Elusimicrobia bacterium]|nr:hypothetical protein [Elusimicrobiota bacterium]